VFAKMLEEFGISEKMLSIMCDNASNNNVMVDDLKALVPTFGGSTSHIRCFLHTVNLVAKSLIREFDVTKKDADRALERGAVLTNDEEEVLNELAELSTNIDCEEIETLSDHERLELQRNIRPIKLVLVKVSIEILQAHL
ncbi:hypothetical protein CY34DRAFT_95904, partial [Suillus luteus UH-Slu-Lm8-n1]